MRVEWFQKYRKIALQCAIYRGKAERVQKTRTTGTLLAAIVLDIQQR